MDFYGFSSFPGENANVLVLCPRDEHAHRLKAGDRSSLTVMMTATADGEWFPPFVVMKGPLMTKPDPRKHELDGCKGAVYICTPSGWMTYESFLEYIQTLDRWLTERDTPRPFLLIMDGHKTHLYSKALRFARNKKIYIYLLEANSTQVSQPLDVSAMRPLKLCWGEAVREFQFQERIHYCSQRNFSLVFGRAFEKLKESNCVVGGFVKTGIYPFDAQKPFENEDRYVGRPGMKTVDDQLQKMGLDGQAVEDPKDDEDQLQTKVDDSWSLLPYVGKHTQKNPICNIKVTTSYRHKEVTIPIPKAAAKHILKKKVSLNLYFSSFFNSVEIFGFSAKFQFWMVLGAFWAFWGILGILGHFGHFGKFFKKF